MSKTRVLVLFGGRSSEHDVSCVSAIKVINSFDLERYEVIKVGITKKGRWLYFPGDTEMLRDGSWEYFEDTAPAYLSPDTAVAGLLHCKELSINGTTRQKIDVAFPVLHGKNGEDGTVQGLLTLAGIPFVGSKVTASAACMDKYITNVMTEHAGVPHCRYRLIKRSQLDEMQVHIDAAVREFGFPIFVKPTNAGSSVGVSKAHNEEEMHAAIMTAAAHDNRILLEEAVDARELECAVLGNDHPFASEIGEILPSAEFYSYDAKYVTNDTACDVPADLPSETSQKIKELACIAYSAMGCNGLARVDFFLRRSDGAILLNEINTIPGFTDISMYPRLMEYSGIPATELMDKLVALALEE